MTEENTVRQRSDSDAPLGEETIPETTTTPVRQRSDSPDHPDISGQLAARDAEFGKLKDALAAAEERIAELSGNLTEAISKYKDRLYSANPELLENMITGETIKDIDDSLGSALLLVDKVKAHVAEQAKEVTVPAGSPERTGGPDFIGGMSAKEKIAYAIGKEAH